MGFFDKFKKKENAETTGADLTVMPGGEHWFHTDEQNEFRWNWLNNKKA